MVARSVDNQVAARMHARRKEVGYTIQEMADLIGITYQQVHKYERGNNRIAAGRLHRIAQVLNVDPSYFFEEGAEEPPRRSPEQERIAAFVDRVANIRDPNVQAAIYRLVRVLAEPVEERSPDLYFFDDDNGGGL